MEIEPLIMGSKWTILELLSTKSHSPTELAEKTKTSLANISQQLRLLELTGLVKKIRQQSREKGKPHMLFSLNQDNAYIVAMCGDFAKKSLIPVSSFHNAILKIWCLTDVHAHHSLQKFYFDAEKYLDDITLLAVSPDSKKLFVVTTSKDTEKKVAEIPTSMEVETVLEKNKAKIPAGSYIIYGKK